VNEFQLDPVSTAQDDELWGSRAALVILFQADARFRQEFLK
jgi:hypothetical protein